MRRSGHPISVIINSNLSGYEEERLLETLRRHGGAIGYTLDELKGISPSIFQHTINIEPDAKPVINHQRRLNPRMKDVVRTKFLKLLSTGIMSFFPSRTKKDALLKIWLLNLEPDAK